MNFFCKCCFEIKFNWNFQDNKNFIFLEILKQEKNSSNDFIVFQFQMNWIKILFYFKTQNNLSVKDSLSTIQKKQQEFIDLKKIRSRLLIFYFQLSQIK